MQTIFLDPCGPLIRREGNMLHISDLNPETDISFRMSRWERFTTGLRFIWSAL